MKTKFTAIVMCLFVMILNSGCSGTSEQNNKTEQNNVSNKEVTYEVSKEIAELEGSYCRYCVKEDKFYTTVVQYDRAKKVESIAGVYVSNSDGSDIRDLFIPENFENKIGMSEFDFDDEQNVYYMHTYMENETNKRELIKLGADGTEIVRTGQADAYDISHDEIRDQFTVTNDGMVVVYSNNELYLLDKNFSLSETISVKEGEIIETTLSKDGDILCILKSSDDKNGYMVSVLDRKNRKLGKFYNMNISGYDTLIQGTGEYDFYYTDEYGIYGYDIEEMYGRKVFDYMASNVTDTDIKPLNNGNFIGEIEQDEDTWMMAIYTKKNYDEENSCKTLTYATVNMDTDIKDAIYNFNNSQSDIEIIIKDYSSEMDPLAKMSTDIITGNIPDLFDLKDLSVEQYIQKGLLEDLTPFYEKDEMIHENDLIPSVLQAMKVDGKIYYVSPGFQVISLAAKVSDVGTADGWDYGDLNNLLRNKDEAAQFFYLNNKQDLLHMMLWCQATDFVDKKTGECYFENEDFKNLLRICNERGVDEEEYEWTESEAVLLRNGDILFRDISTDIEYFKETLAAFGEEINIIGLPCGDKRGNYINFSSQIGISSKSEHKEEAWEFIRSLMTKEYQGAVMSMENLPTRQDCLDLRIEAEMATEDYTNEMGREIIVYDGISDIDGVSYEIKPLTQEQADLYVDMINRAAKVADYDEKIMEIVQEEAGYYFTGERNLDETAGIIQKRVETYINESR